MSQMSAVPCRLLAWMLRPKNDRIPSVWTSAIVKPRKPSNEPTDRSMLRDTMISTMPVAMTAIDELWTDRFHRLRAVRKSPCGQEVEADPDRGEGHEHADQAGVDLERRHRRLQVDAALGRRRPPPSIRVAGGTPVRTKAGASSGEAGSLAPSAPAPSSSPPSSLIVTPPWSWCSGTDVPPVRGCERGARRATCSVDAERATG